MLRTSAIAIGTISERCSPTTRFHNGVIAPSDLPGADAGSEQRGRALEGGGAPVGVRGPRGKVGIAAGIGDRPRDVEERRGHRYEREQRKPRADGADVVEGPRREVGPDHAAASRRPRRRRPTLGASVSANSGGTLIRSANDTPRLTSTAPTV